MKLYSACFSTRSFTDPVNRTHNALYILKKETGDDVYRIKWDFSSTLDDCRNTTEYVRAESYVDAIKKFTERRLDFTTVDFIAVQRVKL